MKTTKHIIALSAAVCLLSAPPLTATPIDEQAAVVVRQQEQIKKVEKLRPDQLDEVLQVLGIEDPLISKAVLRYRTAATNHAALAKANKTADAQRLRAAMEERNEAFTVLKKTRGESTSCTGSCRSLTLRALGINAT
jgi:hypothetical protein